MVSTAKTGASRKRAHGLRLLVACLSAGSVLGTGLPASAQSTPQSLPDAPVQQDANTPPAADAAAQETATAAVADTPSDADAAPNPVTGSIGNVDEEALDLGRMNLREAPLGAIPTRPLRDDLEAPGIRLGTMTLRPSIIQNLGTETTRSGGSKETRTYWETGLRGTLTSNWSRHELTVTGEGYWQKNLSGQGETDPRANVDADLRLDLSGNTIAHLRAGYGFSREDTDDPNAISGAAVQSGIHRLTGGASLEHDFGRLRGTVAADVERWRYSAAELSDGTRVSLSDRDRISGTLRARIGYEISPALTPFLEASIGRIIYDEKTDAQGYARSADVYAAKAGISADFGEKLRGELGLGYRKQVFDDSRLSDIAAVTVDGNVFWSPQRGTDVNIGLSTTIDPSTTAGLSGSVIYALNAAVTHQVRSNLVARLTGSTIWTEYGAGSGTGDTVAYAGGAGLSYSLNRYLDLTADIGYELTDRQSTADTQVWRAMVGLTAKR